MSLFNRSTVMVDFIDIAITFTGLTLMLTYGVFSARESKQNMTKLMHILTMCAGFFYMFHTLLHLDRSSWAWYLTGSILGQYPLCVWWLMTHLTTSKHPLNLTKHVVALNLCLFIGHSVNLALGMPKFDGFILVRVVSTGIYGVLIAKIFYQGLRSTENFWHRKLQKFALSMLICLPILHVAIQTQLADGLLISMMFQKVIISVGTFWFISNTLNYSSKKLRTSLSPPEGKLDEVAKRITRAFEVNGAHRQSTLTIAILSNNIGAPEYLVRRIIIDRFEKQNFSDFVNYHRVAEATRLLKDPKGQNRKISSIAYEVGFTSLSSFNRYFKKITGQKPSELRKPAA